MAYTIYGDGSLTVINYPSCAYYIKLMIDELSHVQTMLVIIIII